jgi:hypothetical protein
MMDDALIMIPPFPDSLNSKMMDDTLIIIPASPGSLRPKMKDDAFDMILLSLVQKVVHL